MQPSLIHLLGYISADQWSDAIYLAMAKEIEVDVRELVTIARKYHRSYGTDIEHIERMTPNSTTDQSDKCGMSMDICSHGLNCLDDNGRSCQCNACFCNDCKKGYCQPL